MKFEEMKRQLERFGEVVASGEDGDIVFTIERSFKGAQTIERLATLVDNTPKAEMVITGNRSSDAVVMVRIPYGAFETVPPYFEDEV